MNPSQTRNARSQPAALADGAAFQKDSAHARKQDAGRVSPTLARMEPWVSWSVAAYSAWIALFLFPDVPAIWLFVLYAGVLGKWCHLFPSRRQGRMFVHGVLILCGAYLLQAHTSERLGGPGGAFFFWTAIPAVAYAFMLKPRWGGALVALSVLEFVIASVVHGTAGVPAMVQAGFLLLFPLVLAMPFGEGMRKPEELLEQTRLDRSTGLFNTQGLIVHGDELLRACRREKRTATMAVFSCEDLLALREMYGRKVGRKARELLVEKLQAAAGSRGIVARTGPCEFSVMLPGLTREKSLQAIARHLGDPLGVEFEVNGEEVVMTPILVIEAARADEPSIEGLHTELCGELMQIMGRVRNGATLQEQPLPVTGRPAAKAFALVTEHLPEGAFVANLPSTMPVALGTR